MIFLSLKGKCDSIINGINVSHADHLTDQILNF